MSTQQQKKLWGSNRPTLDKIIDSLEKKGVVDIVVEKDATGYVLTIESLKSSIAVGATETNVYANDERTRQLLKEVIVETVDPFMK